MHREIAEKIRLSAMEIFAGDRWPYGKDQKRVDELKKRVDTFWDSTVCFSVPRGGKDMTLEELKRIEISAHLIEPPAAEVVKMLADEIRSDKARIAELEKVCVDTLGALVGGHTEGAKLHLRRIVAEIRLNEEENT